jgi:chloramphenicol 3-O-phosphotransferase
VDRRIVLITGSPGAGKSTLALRCRCPPTEAARRYAERAAGVHPVHVVHEPSPEVPAQYDRPLGYGPVIEVDTTGPTDPSGIAAQVRQAFDRGIGAAEPIGE